MAKKLGWAASPAAAALWLRKTQILSIGENQFGRSVSPYSWIPLNVNILLDCPPGPPQNQADYQAFKACRQWFHNPPAQDHPDPSGEHQKNSDQMAMNIAARGEPL